MLNQSIKVLAALSVMALSASPSFAADASLVSMPDAVSVSKIAAIAAGPSTTFMNSVSVDTSQNCAMHLSGEALDIYSDVSPKVAGDSNLRKLVKKNVRPKVLKGKLSIKEARSNAEAAATCLSLLKVEKAHIS